MKATRINFPEAEGLSMRTAAQLVRLARQFHSRIILRWRTQVADAGSLMSIMLLCANLRSPLVIEASGDDEHEAIQAVEACFKHAPAGS